MRSSIKSIFFFSLVTASCSVTSQNWDSLGTGINAQVNAFYTDSLDSCLYVGGYFTTAGGITTKGIAKWNGQTWDSMGSGASAIAPILAITKYNGSIHSAGGFFGGFNYHVVKWNGVSWDSIGKVNSGGIRRMRTISNKLYAVGNVTGLAGLGGNRIFEYNGSSWNSIDTTSWNSAVYDIIKYNNELYIGGNFSNNGLMSIARWNGSSWISVGNGIAGNFSWVNCFEVFQGELYVGGFFVTADGNAGNYIQRWNGNTWSDVGGGMSGMNGQVWDLEVIDNKLYAVGVFTGAGGVPAQYIAYWDGLNWCGLGSVFDNAAGSIIEYNDTIHIGGGFTDIDGLPINRIAKWTGGNYVDTCGNATGVAELQNEQVKIYPNPATTYMIVEVSDNLSQPWEIRLFDNLGREILSKPEIVARTYSIDCSDIPKGFYFYSINVGNKCHYGKMLIQ